MTVSEALPFSAAGSPRTARRCRTLAFPARRAVRLSQSAAEKTARVPSRQIRGESAANSASRRGRLVGLSQAALALRGWLAWLSLPVPFAIQWLGIAAVSAYDTYLTIRHQDIIQDTELNPLGRLLIEADGGPGLFVASKCLGTAMSLGLLILIRERNREWGGTAAAVLAAFQAGLFAFLTFSIP